MALYYKKWKGNKYEFVELPQKPKCNHTPKELLLYRLCVMFTLGVIVGVVIDVFV